MPGRPSWKRLLEATTVIAKVAKSTSLIVCVGDHATWRDVPKRMARSAVEFSSPAEAVDFIREHSYYRTKIFANSYLMDPSFTWLTLFCHDDDWHAYLPETIACDLAIKRAYFELRFRSMPPWPVAALYDGD